MQASSAVAGLPQRTRIYQNHHFDSTRWDYFERRPDDVVIATSYKAGTTWTQSIVADLLFPDAALPGPLGEVSPWLDMRVTPLELVLNELKGQTHRRFVKTHLPWTACPTTNDSSTCTSRATRGTSSCRCGTTTRTTPTRPTS